MIERLTDSNFVVYAMKNYDNPHCCSIEEFNEDLNRFKYIKKLITRYVETGELKERLILNHIIVLNNVFGAQATVRMMFLKLDKYLEYVKPFLIFLALLPEQVLQVRSSSVINTDDIGMNQQVIDRLREIANE